MTAVDMLLPAHSRFGFTAERLGPVRASDFAGWDQAPDNPAELIEGWVLPMSPGNFRTGRVLPALWSVLEPLAVARGWDLAIDARHLLPLPPETVVFPDLALHCGRLEPAALDGTVGRCPDLVVELLSTATAERDQGPDGAKFLVYQMSGVREYYTAWPDGRASQGFALVDGAFRGIPPDAGGFFASPLLGRPFRLVPPALG